MTKIAILLGIVLTLVSIAEKILNMYISWKTSKKKAQENAHHGEKLNRV